MVTLRKRCACWPATASGPRIVFGEVRKAPEGYTQDLAFVEMACDVCDKPWTEDPPPTPPPPMAEWAPAPLSTQNERS